MEASALGPEHRCQFPPRHGRATLRSRSRWRRVHRGHARDDVATTVRRAAGRGQGGGESHAGSGRSVPKVGRPKTPAIPEYWRLARSSLSALRAAPWLESVLVGRNFPVPERRELAGEDVEQGPDRRRWPRPEAGIWAISLYLPCGSGFSAQRRVRDRLHPPPFG